MKSGKFGQRPCLFHISIIVMKFKVTKQTEKNPDDTAHKEPSLQDVHCLLMYVRIYLMSEVTRLYPIYYSQDSSYREALG